MPFVIEKTSIEDLLKIQPQVFNDSRGIFLETYSKRDFANFGFNIQFVQDNMSKSTKGVLRGLHFQKNKPQGKLVRCIEGLIYDIAVDLRNKSKTFGQFYGEYLDGTLHNMLYIPPGFAHGFVVLSDTATFTYKCTDFYYPEDESGIRWNDPTINIPWETVLRNIQPILSDKDKILPYFDSSFYYF